MRGITQASPSGNFPSTCASPWSTCLRFLVSLTRFRNGHALGCLETIARSITYYYTLHMTLVGRLCCGVGQHGRCIHQGVWIRPDDSGFFAASGMTTGTASFHSRGKGMCRRQSPRGARFYFFTVPRFTRSDVSQGNRTSLVPSVGHPATQQAATHRHQHTAPPRSNAPA